MIGLIAGKKMMTIIAGATLAGGESAAGAAVSVIPEPRSFSKLLLGRFSPTLMAQQF